MPVTIRDVAKLAGVSVTTVSQILNQKGERFSNVTHAKVVSAVKELNYQPNRLAKALVDKRSNTIGLIVPDIRNPFFSTLAYSIDAQLNALDYTVLQSSTGDSHKKDIQMIQTMASHLVDGLLFCMASNTTPKDFKVCCDLIRAAHIPFVLLDRHYQDESLDVDNVIKLDHELGGYIATKHLISLGHKNIICITGPLNLTEAKARLNGYTKAMAENKLKIMFLEGNYRSDSGYFLTNKCLENNLLAKEKKFPGKATAIFACNDMMALGAYSALDEAGWKIPKDISLVGFDDIFFSKLPSIKLTTVHQPVERLGKLAVDLLMKKLKPDHSFTPTKLEPWLVERNSTRKI